jgi:hypothetical protein
MCRKAWGFESSLPHFAEVANESLGGADTFSFGKILRQVKGGAIKGGIVRMNSRRDFGNHKEYSY